MPKMSSRWRPRNWRGYCCRSSNREQIHLHSILNELKQLQAIYPRRFVPDLTLAIAEAWHWMSMRGVIVSTGDSWFKISRTGDALGDEAFADFTKSTLLPKEMLHPALVGDAWANFLRGAYDTAVFLAFRAVEVAVRTAAGFDEQLIGTKLMRAAFDPQRGPLTDFLPADDAERDALAHLFAGAIGSYKNPASHRTVVIADAAEAAEMLILASHLLRIVEHRRRRRAGEGPPLRAGSVPAPTVP